MNRFLIQTEDTKNTHETIASVFKTNRTLIEDMYRDDMSAKRHVGVDNAHTSTIQNLTVDSFNTTYFNLSNLDASRKLSHDAYALHPTYSTLIDSLCNIFYWRYTFYPREVKEKTSASYEEVYKTMAETVDGLMLETVMPNLLAKLFIDGALFLTTIKKTNSKTVTTLILPTQYCRMTGISQFGTGIYQFDYSYFDELGLSKEQLKQIFALYPQEMEAAYNAYKKDTNKRWQRMNPKFSAGFSLNDVGAPTYLRALGGILQYDSYRNNELERNEQQLLKIITHKMPTWEDKLVVEVPEMTALHKSMSKVIARNKNVRMLTSFGQLDVLSIGEDQTKENKTLANAYAAIFNIDGENSNLFNGDTKEALEFSLRRKESIIWKYVQELVAFFNLTINNHFNFKGYQCSLNMLPLSVYNFDKTMLQYKEGATLGVSKLEYIVGLGIKQVDIDSKISLESFLKLEQLKPLSTSYTNAQNASGIVGKNNSESSEDDGTDAQATEEAE